MQVRQPRRERRPGPDHERHEENRQDGDGHEELLPRRAEEPQLSTREREDERELSDVREGERGAGRRLRHRPRDPQGRVGRERLRPDDERRTGEDQTWVMRQELRVEQHPDRDEEEAREDVAKRRERRGDVGDRLALGEDDPRREGAHRRRGARSLDEGDDAEDDDEGRGREGLRPRHADESVEDPRHEEAGDGDEDDRSDAARRPS